MRKIYSSLNHVGAVILMLFLNYFSGKAQAVFTQTFGLTSSTQSFVVPSCVSTISLDVRGAQGGNAADRLTTNSTGGMGGRAQGVLTVTSGQTLYIYVGGSGSATGPGGFNGGGSGGLSSAGSSCYGGYAGGGGGASDIRVGGTALSNRVIVAGGGGGSGRDYCNGTCQPCGCGGNGGAGGGLTGAAGTAANTCNGGSYNGTSINFGAGGTATVGGTGGPPDANSSSGYAGTSGTLGIGGTGGAGSYDVAGGGGGGGYYGGGGGGGAGSGSGVGGGGGGGGSSYLSTLTGTSTTSAYQTGDGFVILSYQTNGAGVIASATSNSICAGATPTLTASNVLSYTWSPGGSNSTSIIVNPATTTAYTVQGTNSIGCISTAVITITVDPALPTLTVANTATNGGICPTTSVILTASGASGYTWTGGSSTVTNGVVFNPTISATYTVTGINACGTTTASTSVSINPSPTVTPVASSASLCSGNGLTLTAVGNASNYAWSGGIVNGGGFYPSTTATYTVVGTSSLNCPTTATITVTVVTTPSIAPTAQPALICIGKSSTLTATGAASYTWTGGSVSSNNSSISVTPSSPGISTYTIVRANANCTTTQQVSVVTNSLPTVFAIVSPTVVCALNPATLAVGGAQTYTWTSPGNPPSIPSFTFTGSNPIVVPPVSTTYTVAASDGTCINTTTVALATNPNPTVTATASSSMICAGQSVMVTASGGNSYTWTATSGTFYTASITDTPTTSISYNVIGNNSFGCTSPYSQVVVVNPNPTLTAVANKTLVCSGGASTLTASGADTYTWNGSVYTNTTIVNPTNVITGPVIYTVSGTYTSTTCHSTQTMQVVVFVPTLAVSGNTNTCYGGMLSLTASGGTGNTYSWLTPGNPPYGFATLNTTLTAPSVFTVNAMTSSLTVSCPATKTVAVGIFFNPTITAVAQRTLICYKESVVLSAGGGSTYAWSNGASTNTISVHPIINTTYTVTGTDANGCTNTATVLVKVSGCVGIAEISPDKSGVSVYPNPNNGEFTIETDADLTLTLSNELGQTVKIINLSGANDHKVSVTNLAKGVYFITGQKDGAQINQKIIVSK